MKICATSDLVEHFGTVIERIAPDAQLVSVDSAGHFEGDPDGIEVLVFSSVAGVDRNVMRSLAPIFGSPTLRWMQSPGAGVDHPAFRALFERGVRLTNGSGLHAEPIAQYIFTYVLHWQRNVSEHQAQQTDRKWRRIISDDLTSKTLGIVGLGGIGEAAARVGHAFGMRVVGLRRSATASPNVDLMLPVEELHQLLSLSDYVVLSLPFTDATRHLIGASELSAMRDSAVLINVARGGVVDEAALIDALQSDTIRGATLDVVSEEPLPETSLLWTLDNCIITPHDAGWSPRATERLAALFLDNLDRFVRDESMRNEIGPEDLVSD